MYELRKFVAPEFVFGPGALNLGGRYAKNFGANKVLIVTDPGVIKTGLLSILGSSLYEVGVDYVVFSELSSNPRSKEVMNGAEYYLTNNCDVIIAIGGGSPMDCAKGIGIVSTNKKHVLEFKGVDNVDIPAPPLICIPTTAGTSADVSQFAIINDESERVKIAIISKTVVPDIALIDSKTTLSMDSYLTACTGMDALVHAIEAYVSTANSPIMDIHALEAISLIHSYLLKVIKDPNNIEFRTKVMLGSLEAGLAFSNASLGAVHAMAHSLGGYLDLPHGECNSILLEHVIAFNGMNAVDRYAKIGEVMRLDIRSMTSNEKINAVFNEIVNFKKACGIYKTLKERGVNTGDIKFLAQKAIKDPCMVTNPRTPNQRDIEVIYEEAL